MRTVRPRRLGVRGPATVLLAATTVFALTACGGGDDTGAGSGTTPGASSTPSTTEPDASDEPSDEPSDPATESPSPSPSESATEPEVPKPAKIRVKVVAGEVTVPTDRLAATVGQTVRITITSDVAEELHVHGVEELLALPAGEKQTLEFVVPAEPGPGLYEVELEGSSLLLFQLEVQ
ncbi:MAG: hypothetical protein WKH47_04930 [Actinomycetes bacterium]